MAVARGCRLLESLELPASSQVEDKGLIELGRCCPQLRSVTGNGWNCITDAAVIALASGCPQLEVVQLAHASLTDASADALAQGCPNLKMLDLFETGITVAGLLILARHARQPRLRIRTSLEVPPATLEKYPNVEMFGLPINLKVVEQDGNETYYRCKKTTQLGKLMNVFCNRQGVSSNDVRFLFDGKRIHETQTPEQLDMENGDVIDVMVAQDVGEWEPAHTSSGAEQLLLGAATEDVDAATALDIERTASGPHLSRRAPPASFESVDALLTPAQCARLVAHTEHLASELPPAQRAAPDAKVRVRVRVSVRVRVRVRAMVS
jgi:small ubiquitin-related modifier